jgi:autotransporter-associated beta strand protein
LYISGSLGGSGTIFKTQGYSVFLSATNSGFTGTYSNQQSYSFFSQPYAGSAGATWSITGGAIATTLAGNQTISLGALSGNGGQLGNNIGSSLATYSIGALGATSAFGGNIVDSVGGGGTTAIHLIGGKLTLAGTNTFSGGTTISNGTLLISADNNLGSTNCALTFGGGTLETTNNFALSPARTVTMSASGGTFSIESGSTLTANQSIGGDGALTKTGPGKLALAGANNYSGGTTVGNGTLFVSGLIGSGPVTVGTGATLTVNGSIGGGAVAISAGGTLDGSGTLGGSVTSDGLVAPGGTNIAVLTFQGYTQTANGVLNIKLAGISTPGTDYDSINANGPANLGGTLNVTIVNTNYQPANGDTLIIVNNATTLNGTTFVSTNLPTLASGLVWNVDYSLGSVVILSVTNNPTLPPTGYDLWAGAITNGQTNCDQSALGDGYPNLLKYATGANPTNPADAALAHMRAARSNGVFALQFFHNLSATDVTMIVEGTSTATNDAAWNGIATNLQGSWGGAPNVSENSNTVPAAVTVWDTDAAATNRFLRLRVTRP